MLYGLLNLSFWGYVIAILVLTHITIVSVTVFLHRGQAHKAIEFHPIASHFFRFWLWLTTGMNTKEWVAIHRKHHAHCETVNDPHSPQIRGIRKVLWEGTELYREEAKNQETLERYGVGTPDDWIERKLYTSHSQMGITIMFILDLLLFGIPGITVWAIQMVWIPFWAAGVINGISHYWGYRNFECLDASRNIFPIAFLIGGEELHNNHHTFPTSAKLSVKKWEFDIGWGYIKLLQWLRLLEIKRVAPKLKTIPSKNSIDMETLGAFFTNRFSIMAEYTHKVVLPVMRAEKLRIGDTGRQLFQSARALLVRDGILIDQSARQQLSALLAQSQALDLVYQYRLKLQAIWERTTTNQKELLEALQEWCKQAETAGIQVLSEFSKRLKTLVPQSA